jgi:oligopeptidase A
MEFTFPLGIENSAFLTELGEKTYEEFIPISTEFEAKLSQNEEFAAAVIKIYETEELSDVRKRILEKKILNFKSSGIGLDQEAKEKITNINLELAKLGNDFEKNITDATNEYKLIVEDESILAEMPELDKNSAKTEDGNFKFTLHGPSFVTFMKYCNNQEKREEFYKAFITRAPQNEDLLVQILKLNDEKAKILGYENFREFSMATKTANNSKEVIDFLTELGVEALPTAKQEVKELTEFASENLGINKVNVFDQAYISRKFKEANFNFDPSEVKPYFEKDRVVEGMFNFLEDIFGLKTKKIDGIKVWSEKANIFELSRNGKVLGNLILDLETGEQKRGGAWADSWTHSYDENGELLTAIGVVVCNFPQSKEGIPSLLDHYDVVVLFHEMLYL